MGSLRFLYGLVCMLRSNPAGRLSILKLIKFVGELKSADIGTDRHYLKDLYLLFNTVAVKMFSSETLSSSDAHVM